MGFNPYELIAKDIVKQLQPLKNEYGIEVKSLPEKPKNFSSVSGDGWLVFWINNLSLSDYSLGEQSGIETVTYNLDLRAKNVRDEGIEPIIYSTRLLLWGYQPSICYRGITTLDMNFLGTNENYWAIGGTFVCYLYAGYSQQYIDPESLVPLNCAEVGDVIIPYPDE